MVSFLSISVLSRISMATCVAWVGTLSVHWNSIHVSTEHEIIVGGIRADVGFAVDRCWMVWSSNMLSNAIGTDRLVMGGGNHLVMILLLVLGLFVLGQVVRGVVLVLVVGAVGQVGVGVLSTAEFLLEVGLSLLRLIWEVLRVIVSITIWSLMTVRTSIV